MSDPPRPPAPTAAPTVDDNTDDNTDDSIEITRDLTFDTTAVALRQRADRLVAFAHAIERQRVHGLPDLAVRSTWRTGQAGLCEQMLRRNLHQLSRVIDELRSTAHRMRARADRIDTTRAA